MPGTITTRLPLLTIRGIRTSAVEVPMRFPLGTSAGTVHSAPLLLIDLETEEGINGRTYLFCYRPSVPRAIDVVLRDAVSVEYVDWAGAILEEPLQIQDGLARVPERPGIGLTWRTEAVKALSLDR